MRIFRKRTDEFDPSNVDPQEALRRARDAIASTGTYTDAHGRRRRLSPQAQERLAGSLDAAAAAQASGGDLPIWPTGIARFSNGILEVTTGEGIRVAARDIEEIYVKAPRAGRFSLKVKYRAGLGWRKHGYWVEAQHEAALHALVSRVTAAAA
jgi:hypothetical protein